MKKNTIKICLLRIVSILCLSTLITLSHASDEKDDVAAKAAQDANIENDFS